MPEGRGVVVAALVAVFGLLAVADEGVERQQNRSATTSRVAPPGALSCDRNQLTSYDGTITSVRLGKNALTITITIETDYGTTESVRLTRLGARDTSRFLLRGAPLRATEVLVMEDTLLREGTRIIAWVCLDGKTEPVIDFRSQVAQGTDHGL